MESLNKDTHSDSLVKWIVIVAIIFLILYILAHVLKNLLNFEVFFLDFLLSLQGSLFYLAVSSLFLVVLLLLEISNTKSKAAVHITETKFQALVENSYDAISLLDKNGKFVYCSPSTQRVTGYAPEELIGKNAFAIVHPDDLEQTQQKMAELLQKPKNTVSAEYRILHKDGTWHWMEGIAINLLEDPVISAIVSNYRDISARKMADIMKKDFISLVSHQLKSPVAQLSGFIDNMLYGLTGELSEKQRDYLVQMQEINKRNYKMIADLLNISRIERGVIIMDLHPWKLSDIVNTLIEEHRDLISKRGLKFEVFPIEQDVDLLVDKPKIVEAVGNIIKNAIKFTDYGSIGLRTRVDEKIVYIEITDSGKGMSEDLLKKLFNRDQIMNGSASVEKGAGLGLFIAKQFLILHNGDVRVTSMPDKGSTFTVLIPKYVYNKELSSYDSRHTS